QEDCAPWLRIVWAATTGLLTMGMLIVGGITALQYATIIMGLPFAVVLVLVMISLYKALRVEGHRADTVGAPRPHLLAARIDSREPWKARLARATNFVDVDDAVEHLRTVVEPALTEVAEELTRQDVSARVQHSTLTGGVELVELVAEHETHPFIYRVQVDLAPVPTYGGRMIG